MTQQSYDDLFLMKPLANTLYLYKNNPANPGVNPFANTANVIPITHPGCNAPSGYSCASYTSTGNWSNVAQILSPGDAWNGDAAGTSITSDTGVPSLLTVENDHLWLYQGQNGNALANPIELGSTGWSGMTLISPGTINGQLTLWTRQNSTGTIYSYPITLINHIPTLNPANPGTPITATSGSVLRGFTSLLPAATYPTIASTGDTNTSTGPSLYTISTSGQVIEYAGTPSGNPSSTATSLTTITPGSIFQIS
jgi:hypothetical protein